MPRPKVWRELPPSTPYPCKAKHLGKLVPGRDGGRAVQCATPDREHPNEGQLWLVPASGTPSHGRAAPGVFDRLAPTVSTEIFGTTKPEARRARPAAERVRPPPAPPPRRAAQSTPRAAPSPSASEIHAQLYGTSMRPTVAEVPRRDEGPDRQARSATPPTARAEDTFNEQLARMIQQGLRVAVGAKTVNERTKRPRVNGPHTYTIGFDAPRRREVFVFINRGHVIVNYPGGTPHEVISVPNVRDAYRVIVDRVLAESRSQSVPAPQPRAVPAPRSVPASPAPSAGRSSAVDPEVVDVLERSTIRGNALHLPSQLDRKLYQRVAKVIEALGGRWVRKVGAHVFPADPTVTINAMLESGRVVRPRDIGWFPTPPDLAARIVSGLHVRAGAIALEPSAGEGAIAEELRRAGAKVWCAEIDAGRAQTLRSKGFTVIERDFLAMDPLRHSFDLIVMNPPFEHQQDIVHVRHALNMLRPGGQLVAIMSSGVEWRQDARSEAFRVLVRSYGGSMVPLPDGSFRASGTAVRTVLVTIVSP